MSTAPGGLAELAAVGSSLTVAVAACAAAWHARAGAAAERRARAAERAAAAALGDAACRLARAARSSVQAVREEIVRAAGALAPAFDGVLCYEEHDGELRCVLAAGERFGYFAGSRLALDDPAALPARALQAGHRVTTVDPGTTGLHPRDAGALAAPLALDAGRAGVVAFASLEPLDARSLDALAALAEHAAPAYAIALDRERDRRDAEFDGLTGLLTPRAFRRRLSARVAALRATPAARLALLFVDTDHFKQYNDRCGHAAGDALLTQLAGVLRAAARSDNDLIARNGGDEFCVVLTETDKATAIERADALRRRIAALDQAAPDGRPAITASIGVAALGVDALTANGLLERADAAMYHSKEHGRNGVSYAGPDGTLVRLTLEAGA